MRIVFAGTPDVAAYTLDHLITQSSCDVVGVLTRPAQKKKDTISISPVAKIAQERNIPLFSPPKVTDPAFVQFLYDEKIDCVAVVAYGALLPEKLLTIPRYGWINVHFSLLPLYRGAAPVQAAIQYGENVTGVTTFRIDPGMDTGPVLGQVTEPILPNDTTGTLLEKLQISGATLLIATLDGLEQGLLQAQPQNSQLASYAPKVTPDMAKIRWDQRAFLIDRLIRSMAPKPGSWTFHHHSRLKISEIQILETQTLAAGECRRSEKRIIVGTGDNDIELITVQPEGKKKMHANAWFHGLRAQSTQLT